MHPWFPLSPETCWTFRDTEGAETQLRAVPADPTARVWVPPRGEDVGASEIAVGEALRLEVDGDGLGAMLAVEDADGLRFFEEDPMSPVVSLRWKLPQVLRDGLTWEGEELLMSCGWARFPQSYTARAEELDVPAGRFSTLRVEIQGEHTRRWWLAEGVGPVAFAQGSQRLELTAWRRP